MQVIRKASWLHLVICGLICMGSIMVNLRIYARPMGDVLARIPTMVDGLYAPEQSDYLQATNARQDGMFQWSKPSVLFQFWPAPATSRIFTLTYSAPESDIQVETRQQHISTIPKTSAVRVAHVLTPADAPFDILVQTSTPHRAANESRELGFIFLGVTWRATTDIQTTTVAQWWLLVEGMGVSTLLGMVLMVVMRQSLRRAAIVGFGYTIIMWVAGSIVPWTLVAMQSTIQFVLIIGIIGVLLHRWVSQVVTPEKHVHLIIFGVWLVSFLCFFRPQINSDGVGYYAYVRSLFIDGNFDFANEFNRTLSPFPNTPTFSVYAPTGYTMNPWSIGPALIWTPFWLLGHGMVLLTSDVTGWARNGYSEPYVVLTCFVSSIAGLCTLYATYLLVRRWFNSTIALYTSTSLFLGTNLLFYAQYEGSYPHSLAALCTTLLVLLTIQIADEPDVPWWHWVRLGVAGGLLVLSYWMNSIICVFPTIVLLHRLWHAYTQHDRLRVRNISMGIGITIITAVLTVSPQFGIWYLLGGQLFSVYSAKTTYITIFGTKLPSILLPSENHLVEYFFGPTYGLLWWTPLYLVGICGSLFFARKYRVIGIAAFITICCYIFYNATTSNWHGSGAFGMRRMTTLLPFFALGIAYLCQKWHHIPSLVALIWSCTIGWEIRFIARHLQYVYERAPQNYLYDLSASLFTPQLVPVTTFAYPIRLSWFFHQLRTLSIESVMLLCVVGACTWGAYVLSKRMFVATS